MHYAQADVYGPHPGAHYAHADMYGPHPGAHYAHADMYGPRPAGLHYSHADVYAHPAPVAHHYAEPVVSHHYDAPVVAPYAEPVVAHHYAEPVVQHDVVHHDVVHDAPEVVHEHTVVHTAGDRSDAHRTFEEICEENGFAFEIHEVTTDDGYILNVFRIPGLAAEQVHESVEYHGSRNVSKPPILMQHGLFDSAYCWIVNYGDVAPAFVAARAGYDVWLGNSRGNTFSRHHNHLDPDHDEKKFWDFTWKDMGKYDLPAVIDMIQSETGYQKVAYIGHSQGTTQMYSALAEDPDFYSDKISLFVSLGPVSMIPHTDVGLMQFTSHFYDVVVDTADTLGVHEIGGMNWFTHGVADAFCVHIPEFCEAIMSLFVNHHPEIDDDDRFAVYAGHSPNGSSLKSIEHYT